MFRTPERGDGRREFAIHGTGARQNGDGDTYFTVATIQPSFEPAKRPWIHDYTEEEAEANARIIAAARELLEAVETAHEFFINPHKFNPLDVEKKYEAAIRKARGQL